MTEVHEAHKQLYHYTNFEGLKGILESQTLWATHFRHLNDSSEIEAMRPLLEEKVFEIVNTIVRKKAKDSFKYKNSLEKKGGITQISRKQARDYTDIFYERSFLGSPGKAPLIEPFILSFCAHSDRDEYVKKNGLLSQWRAYGGDGGYALVFDTKRLEECLETECRTYSYSCFFFGDVIYDHQSDKFEKAFDDLHKGLEDWLNSLAEEKNRPSKKFFEPLFDAATRFKHRGFEEESEVRVSTAPVTGVYAKEISESAQDSDASSFRIFKPILKKPGSHAPYIALNDGPKKKPLPILRIIVGPQQDQQQCAEKVKRLVGKRNIRIVCSETPYLPPQARTSG